MSIVQVDGKGVADTSMVPLAPVVLFAPLATIVYSSVISYGAASPGLAAICMFVPIAENEVVFNLFAVPNNPAGAAAPVVVPTGQTPPGN